MAVEFENKGQSVSPVEIESVEAVLGVSLPSDYRQFLARHNGAEPESNILWIGENQAVSVRTFLAVSELLTEQKKFKDELPASILPIAYDGCGNYICIDLNGGSVLFWDHEEWEALSPVAESFETFWEKLKRFDPTIFKPEVDEDDSVWIHPDFRHLSSNFPHGSEDDTPDK